ncbi:MAG: hypothetical protein DYG85_04815 [Chloroflexi bacterium CFX1]|nr:hypothetical protein [Chloroflexi bacterium CFX1]
MLTRVASRYSRSFSHSAAEAKSPALSVDKVKVWLPCKSAVQRRLRAAASEGASPFVAAARARVKESTISASASGADSR